MENISFSIVVATKSRVKLLTELIESIDVAGKNYCGECEVLIVDDSIPEESEAVRKVCEEHSCEYVFYENSVAAKRNYGVTLAKNDVILFLDSDCICTEHILERYAEKYTDEKVAAVAGPLEFVGEDTWFWKAIEATPFLTCFYLPRFLPRVEWGVTANFSVRKSVFLEVGGFDETFRRPAGEDVDLGMKICDKGYVINAASEAGVYHSKKTWIPVRAMFRRLNFYGTADCDLIHKHPDRGDTVLPKRSMLYIIYSLLIAAIAIASKAWWVLAGIPLVFLAENLVMSALVNSLSKEKKATLLQQFVAQLLIHDSDFAYLRRCVTSGRFSEIRRQMVYYLGQYGGMLEIGSYNTWLQLVLLMVIAAVMMIVL
ncbi:MAG: glycosyltransferase [Oscillospiraceae bacterium]|nr:glycosyltransferase [Oscillospiraceae bacterium]